MTQAIWNVIETAAMSQEQNLRNLCRQFEQAYVEWKRPATHGGFRLSTQWPAIGELGRYGVAGVRVSFVTTYKREMEVRDAQGKVIGKVKMLPGMAQELYVLAGTILDQA